MKKEKMKQRINTEKIKDHWDKFAFLESYDDFLDFKIERFIRIKELFDDNIDIEESSKELEDQLMEVLP